MTYSNNWKLANGSTIAIGATTLEDAISIGIPGVSGEKLDITSLGSTFKEYAISEILDAAEFTVQFPMGEATFTPSDTPVFVTITLAKLTKTVSFDGKIVSFQPQAAEVNGKLVSEVTLVPAEVPVWA